MKHTFKTFLLLGIAAGFTPSLHAGCTCIPGNFTVQGNFSYDSMQGAYLFLQGDTLRVTYHAANGEGDGYVENYYRDDTLLVGHYGDTLVVTLPATYQAKIGCLVEQNSTSIRFAYASPTPVNDLTDEPLLKAYRQGDNLMMYLDAGMGSNFQLQVYDLSGRLLLQQDNLQAQTNYSFPAFCEGLKLVHLSYLYKGELKSKTVKLF